MIKNYNIFVETLVTELMENRLKTEYKVNKYGYLVDGRVKDRFELIFETYSGFEYKIDFLPYSIKACTINLGTNYAYNISFSGSENSIFGNVEEYNNPTKRNEEIEVFSRVLYILDDFKIDHNVFVVGETRYDIKNKIYNYIINKCFPNYIKFKNICLKLGNGKTTTFLVKKEKD